MLKGVGRVRVGAALLLFLPGLAVGQAVDTTKALPVDDAKLLGRSVGRAVTSPLRWDSGDLVSIGAAAGLVAGVSLLDGSIRGVVNRNRSPFMDDVMDAVEPLGTVANYRILAGLYLTGVAVDRPHLRQMAVGAVASSLVAGILVTPTIQTVVGRARPRMNEPVYTFDAFSDGHSFPSGHVTQAFAVASVIAIESESTLVDVTAYGVAGMVAASRMYTGAHFLSDVTAGALIGMAVGRAVAGVVDRSGRAVQVYPTPDGIGLSFPTRF